jgi:hypothetical protein
MKAKSSVATKADLKKMKNQDRKEDLAMMKKMKMKLKGKKK